MVIDKQKLRDAITIQDTQVVEKMASSSDFKLEMPQIDGKGLTEEQYLERAVEAIGPLKKTARKTLEKDSFIKVFKYTGEFAKMKCADLKAKA